MKAPGPPPTIDPIATGSPLAGVQHSEDREEEATERDDVSERDPSPVVVGRTEDRLGIGGQALVRARSDERTQGVRRLR